MIKSRSINSGLVRALTEIAQPKLMRRLLKDLLTPQELVELSGRWRLVTLLKRGWPQRKIAARLGVGIATVTRGARMLRNPNGGFNQILK